MQIARLSATDKASRQDASEIDGLRRLFFTSWRSSSETPTRAKTASVGLAALSADTVGLDVSALYYQQAAEHPLNLSPRGDELVKAKRQIVDLTGPSPSHSPHPLPSRKRPGRNNAPGRKPKRSRL
jgi:hypothetical protein